MSLQTVPLFDVPRNLLNDDRCPICLESAEDDDGKTWLAHLDKRNRFIHAIHKICFALMSQNPATCCYRDVRLTYSFTLKEKIGLLLLINANQIGSKMAKLALEISGAFRVVLGQTAGMLLGTAGLSIINQDKMVGLFTKEIFLISGICLVSAAAGIGPLGSVILTSERKVAKSLYKNSTLAVATVASCFIKE